MQRKRTSTSNFGVGRREGHDASAFYRRFRVPDVSADDTVVPPYPVAEPFCCGDSRSMTGITDGSVALVVTSPPYYAGKAYEEEMGRSGVPASYLDYLQMLAEVFAECTRKLEPGGRIAVNVANLGRKPYRSLASDVIRILQDDLGLLLRGEIVWQKGEGASGSCAWGSFRRAANPVLRDVTERVVVASKGRFDRALAPARREAAGLPHASDLPADDFLSSTLDLWSLPPESARRVGHPAPFPVELPEQLIRLYTYRGDLVVDPFMGSGSTLVAAARLGRRYAGFDLDPDYVEVARRRVGDALGEPVAHRPGDAAPRLAAAALAAAGFDVAATGHRVPGSGVTVDFLASDRVGGRWLFDVAGPNTTHRGGLLRAEAVWRTLGRAAAVRGVCDLPLVVLTTDLPRRPGEGDTALRAAGPRAVRDVIDLLDPAATGRLARYATGEQGPVPGFWTPG